MDILFFVIPIGMVLAYLCYKQISKNKVEKGNPYKMDWEKVLRDKSKEELLEIIDKRQEYAPEFIEMVKEKLNHDFGGEIEMEETVPEITRPQKPKAIVDDSMLLIRNWGWFVVIAMFLILVAVMSICQAADEYSSWQFLNAGWWFIIFYFVCMLLFAIVKSKIRNLWHSRKNNNEGTMVQYHDGNTRDLFLETLTKIGCQYEVDEDNRIVFQFQSGTFIAHADNDCRFVIVIYPSWYEGELYDIDTFAAVKRIINVAQWDYHYNIMYQANEASHTYALHSKRHFIFMPQIPQIDEYLRVMLGGFFQVQQYVMAELEKSKKE